MRRLLVLSTGRQDWGIVRSSCLAARRSGRLEVGVLAAGMHLSAAHGRPISLVEADGIPVAAALETYRERPEEEAAVTVTAVAEALARLGPEALLVAGDRSETAAAALAATLGRVPLVHLHGGEETEGAIDNALRHAITKLAHLHLVSHAAHAARVRQMGEDPAAIHVVGAPALDALHDEALPDRAALEQDLGIALAPPVLVLTHHPATLGADPAEEGAAVLGALEALDATVVVTLPNSDAGARALRRAQLDFVARRPGRRVAVEALGSRRYFGLLRLADAVVGNSSSALIEAPVLELPAVNVGDRQRGRLRGANVLDAAPEPAAVAAALARALDPAFRAGLAGSGSPYGDGRSAERIVTILERWAPPSPPRKVFRGLP